MKAAEPEHFGEHASRIPAAIGGEDAVGRPGAGDSLRPFRGEIVGGIHDERTAGRKLDDGVRRTFEINRADSLEGQVQGAVVGHRLPHKGKSSFEQREQPACRMKVPDRGPGGNGPVNSSVASVRTFGAPCGKEKPLAGEDELGILKRGIQLEDPVDGFRKVTSREAPGREDLSQCFAGLNDVDERTLHLFLRIVGGD